MDLVALVLALKAGKMTQAEFTAAAAQYIEDHPDAIDQAALEAILDGRLDGIEDDVNDLKNAVEDLEAGSLSAVGAANNQVPVAYGNGSWAWGNQSGVMQRVQVSGTTPTISGVNNTQYICGEVATLGITLPASGCIDVIFESGSTPTVLTVTPQSGQTMHWPEWFDANALEANTRYEISIDNTYGVVATWA